MSDHIPFEMQEKIMKRLPVKSLIRFRSVSKAWKTLIDSPQFIYAHSVHHSHSRRLLVGYQRRWHRDKTYVSIIDDVSFPLQKVDLTVPLSVNLLKDSKVVGSCHGLLCLSGYYALPDDSVFEIDALKVAVVWNPSIRKSIAINIPNSSDNVFGFGVCSVTRDPKILLASSCRSSEFVVRNESSITRQLKVFKLSFGAWQSTTINLPYEFPRWFSQAVVDGFIYSLVSNRISVEGEVRCCSLIMSFDLANDELKEVHLPESLARKPTMKLSINKLRDSLAVVDFSWDNKCCDVWKMEDGVPDSFTKSFTLKLPDMYIHGVLGFNQNGNLIVEMRTFFHGSQDQAALGVYNPVSKRIHYSKFFGRVLLVSGYSYTETLLLLNHKNFDYCFDIGKYKNDDFGLSTMHSFSVE